MTLIKANPSTPRTIRAWRAGDFQDDLSKLKRQADNGCPDAIARLNMLKGIELRSGK